MAGGRRPQANLSFTPEQLTEARRLVAKRNAPHVQVQRAHLMLQLAENPHIPNRELGELIKAHRNMVSKWRGRWGKGDIHLDDEARAGRPLIFSPHPNCSDQSGRL